MKTTGGRKSRRTVPLGTATNTVKSENRESRHKYRLNRRLEHNGPNAPDFRDHAVDIEKERMTSKLVSIVSTDNVIWWGGSTCCSAPTDSLPQLSQSL